VTGSALAALGVSFSYIRGKPLLCDWSYEFHEGTVTALTGPSGCGKSTLLYLLGLLLRPSAGDVSLRGYSQSSLSDRERSARRASDVGFVFQDAALDASRTVMANVLETALYRGRPRRREEPRARELLDRFGVAVSPRARPGQVSGGQAQRIALCRALLARPSVILADEPTGNLDQETGAMVLRALRSHAEEGGCVVVVTHDPVVASGCDHVIEMDGPAW
jgi:ABC-type lipoprotein export system ATPase subunit